MAAFSGNDTMSAHIKASSGKDSSRSGNLLPPTPLETDTDHQVQDVLNLLDKLSSSTDFEQVHSDKIQAAIASLPPPLSTEAAAAVRTKFRQELQANAEQIDWRDGDEGDDAMELLPKPEMKMKHHHNDVPYLAALCLVIMLYIFISGMIFMAVESNQGWSMIDGWYFAVVTIGTVGYGVLTPSHDVTRGLVVIYLMGGMVFFLFTMSILCNYLLDRLETYTKENSIHKKTGGVCGPRSVGLLGFFFLIVLSGTLYGLIFEDWNLIESLYFTIVTITTVGYGDYTPTTQRGRLLISFFILLAGGCFSAIVGGVIASYISIRSKAAALMFMMGPLTKEKLDAMDKDENGNVGREQFMFYMITSLGYMTPQDVHMIDDCFTAMDVDGNGLLNVTDIVSSVQGHALMDVLRRRHGIKRGDESKLPLGMFGLRFKFVQEGEEVNDEFSTRVKQAHEYKTPEQKVAIVDEYQAETEKESYLDALREGLFTSPNDLGLGDKSKAETKPKDAKEN